MKHVVLTRQETGDQGTFGVISVGDRAWFTVERPWLDNASDVSCIPAGLYDVAMTRSRRFRTMMYLLAEVPGRFGVRIHPANLSRQLNGCIALGEKRGRIDGVKAVLVSKPAVRAFEASLGGKPFRLEVRNGY